MLRPSVNIAMPAAVSVSTRAQRSPKRVFLTGSVHFTPSINAS